MKMVSWAVCIEWHFKNTKQLSQLYLGIASAEILPFFQSRLCSAFRQVEDDGEQHQLHEKAQLDRPIVLPVVAITSARIP